MWPGPCVFPDFTQSKVRAWWASLVKEFISNGVDGIWNDMNEPAIFKVILKILSIQLQFFLRYWRLFSLWSSQAVTKTMPESNVHRGDNELGGCQSHAYYHNVLFLNLVSLPLFLCAF